MHGNPFSPIYSELDFYSLMGLILGFEALGATLARRALEAESVETIYVGPY